MSSTILQFRWRFQDTPRYYLFIFEPWIKKESIKKMELRLCAGWKCGCVCFHEFHHILGSITISLYLGIWFVPPQPIEKTAGRADLRKSIFFFLPVRSFGYLSNRAGCRNNFSSREGQSKLDLIRDRQRNLNLIRI